eukprot:scaffold23467_cov48-Attheya_sp.AAC.2
MGVVLAPSSAMIERRWSVVVLRKYLDQLWVDNTHLAYFFETPSCNIIFCWSSPSLGSIACSDNLA